MTLDTERIEFDDLEIGELAVQYEDRQPEDVLEWAMGTFDPKRFAIVTSFQIDGSVPKWRSVFVHFLNEAQPHARCFLAHAGYETRSEVFHKAVAGAQRESSD